MKESDSDRADHGAASDWLLCLGAAMSCTSAGLNHDRPSRTRAVLSSSTGWPMRCTDEGDATKTVLAPTLIVVRDCNFGADAGAALKKAFSCALIESLENGLGFLMHLFWRLAFHYLK